MLWEENDAGSQANSARVRRDKGEGDHWIGHAQGGWYARLRFGKDGMSSCPHGVKPRAFDNLGYVRHLFGVAVRACMYGSQPEL